jgi:Putative transposase
MTLAPDEFIRRFLLHILPNGFPRIRHYRLLASATCKANIARAKELIAAPLLAIDPPASMRSQTRPPPPPARHAPAAAAA